MQQRAFTEYDNVIEFVEDNDVFTLVWSTWLSAHPEHWHMAIKFDGCNVRSQARLSVCRSRVAHALLLL